MKKADAKSKQFAGRSQVQKKNRAYQKQLQSLACELSLARERQRRQTATELHENIGQILAVSRIKLDMLRKSVSSPELAEPLDEITALMNKTIQNVRSLAFELSPPILNDLGLEDAVAWLLEQIEKRHGITYQFEYEQKPKLSDDDINAFLYHAVRELLLNVARHADADEVKVSIRRHADTIKITVADNGVGFDAAENTPKQGGKSCLGLFGIRERLRCLGGKLTVQSNCGCGTCITLKAPLKCEDIQQRHREETELRAPADRKSLDSTVLA